MSCRSSINSLFGKSKSQLKILISNISLVVTAYSLTINRKALRTFCISLKRSLISLFKISISSINHKINILLYLLFKSVECLILEWIIQF